MVRNVARVVSVPKTLRTMKKLWAPRTVGHVNDFVVKLVKLKGEFVWHTHRRDDEMFYVVRGRLLIHLRTRTVALRPGEFFVVPKGVEHKPQAKRETHIVLFERATVKRSGD